MSAAGLDLAELERVRAAMETDARRRVDPIHAVPEGSPLDRELAAFVCAGLAFGNVQAIQRSVRATVDALAAGAALPFAVHRWVRGPDIEHVAGRIRELQARHGSLGRAYLEGYAPGDPRGSTSRWIRALAQGVPATRGTTALLTDPARGSACKRLCLFLRWMVRRDFPDLGLWPEIAPSDLRAPLDVHVIAFARRAGLTRRGTADWRMAEEVTAAFARHWPEDPLRYDFAISHWGMVHGWRKDLS